MRKPLIALGLALSTSWGAVPVADVLAAPSNSHLGNNPTPSLSAKSSNSKTRAVSGAAIVSTAMKYIGYPYTATGNSPSTGFSCIGFVSYVYRSNGIPLPGDLGGALASAPQVGFSSLLPGDVLYFQNTVWPGLSHAAIYLGAGRFVHAEYYGYGVRVSSFNGDSKDGNYWIGKYMTANRPWTGAAVPSLPGSTPPGPPSAPTTQSVTGVASGPSGVVTNSVNVRSRPNKSAGVIQVMSQGTNVVIIGKKHGWYHVQLPDGTVGWVMGQYVQVGSSPGATSANVGTPTAPASASYPATTNRHVTVSVHVNGLRVHAGPSTGSAVVNTAYRGQRLQVLGHRQGWTKVRMPDGTVGWITSSYANGQSRPAGQARSSSSARTFSGGRTAQVAVNLRSAPSLNSPVITVVPAGGRYRVLGRSGGWLHVQVSAGLVGWISGSAATGSTTTSSRSYTSGRSASPRTRARAGGAVLGAGVRLHTRPGVKAPVVALAAAGTRVRVLGHSRGWTLVRLPNGTTGYVLGTYIG